MGLKQQYPNGWDGGVEASLAWLGTRLNCSNSRNRWTPALAGEESASLNETQAKVAPKKKKREC
jgi:hypothetical protein